MLVIAGIAFDVKADNEDEAETKLLEFLSFQGAPGSWGDFKLIKMWVSAKQDGDERVVDINAKETEALNAKD